MTEKIITISERGLMDLIKQSHDLLTQGKPIEGLLPGDNGELDEPIHMDPGPYEPDDQDFCAYCGEKLRYGQTGFCSEDCENAFYDESHLDRHIENEERRAKCQK